jgi:hypothetical protein
MMSMESVMHWNGFDHIAADGQDKYTACFFPHRFTPHKCASDPRFRSITWCVARARILAATLGPSICKPSLDFLSMASPDQPALELSDIVHVNSPSPPPMPQDPLRQRSSTPDPVPEAEAQKMLHRIVELGLSGRVGDNPSSRERELVDMVRVCRARYFY